MKNRLYKMLYNVIIRNVKIYFYKMEGLKSGKI